MVAGFYGSFETGRFGIESSGEQPHLRRVYTRHDFSAIGISGIAFTMRHVGQQLGVLGVQAVADEFAEKLSLMDLRGKPGASGISGGSGFGELQ